MRVTRNDIIISAILLAIVIGMFVFLFSFPSSPPQVGTAIGVQNVFSTAFTNPTEVAYVDTSDVELATSGDVLISFSYTPCTSVTFGEDAGILSWKDGVVTFEGDMDASARIFFDYFLRPMIRHYIREELMK